MTHTHTHTLECWRGTTDSAVTEMTTFTAWHAMRLEQQQKRGHADLVSEGGESSQVDGVRGCQGHEPPQAEPPGCPPAALQPTLDGRRERPASRGPTPTTSPLTIGEVFALALQHTVWPRIECQISERGKTVEG